MIKKILIPIFAFFTSNFVFAQIDSPTNLQVQTINSEYLLLNWDTINSENLKYYIIYQNTSPNAVTEVYTTELGNNDVDYSFLNPIENTTYYLRIRAIDLNDNLSDFSEEVAITWLETPNIISSSIINDSLEVSISAISTAGSFKFYRLYYKNDTISDFILQDSSEFANNLDVILKIPIPENNGFSYKYYISSVDTLNNEYVSEIDTFIIPDNIAPEIPVNLTGENLDKSIKLSWDEILNSYNDFLSYYIYQGTAPNPTTLVDSTTYYFTNQNEFIINGLTNGQIYYLRITAKDKNGNESAYSNEISITPTDITPPEIPQDLSISIGNQQISLSWSPVPNTDADLNGYWVYQGSESGNLATITSTTLTNITVPSLTNNSQYFFAVSSYDLSTNQSALSSELSGIPTELESETNNNFSTANVIDQKIRANLSTNDIDIFKFTGITSSEYDIYTTMPVNKLNGVNDTKIYLFDADTTVLLAQDDNSGTENYSKIRYTVPYDTTYYIKTIGATSNIIGDYQLIIFERKRDKFEINNNFSSASSLSNNSKIDSLSIYPMSDVDIFSFTANECDQLNLYFDSENFNGKIKLYNNNQELLETIDNTDFGDYINHIATYSGIYYASYESSDINNTSTGDYTLNFSIEKPASITNSILINEIQANIFTTNYADSLQFIELYNKGSVFVDLGGLKFSDGINFQFPEYSVLSPKSYFVIAKNQSAFTNFYGFEADYIWTSGTLSNISDTLLFVNQSDSIIDYVIYTNNTPFPQTENSENSSLELTNSEISNMSGTNWHASYLTNGTPKARNSVLSVYTDDIYENNNEITDAKRLMAGRYTLTMSAIEESNNADTVDWFYYKAEAQEKLEINAETNTESFFYYLYVYDSAGALLTANEDSASAKSVDYIFTQNQDIFIKIRAIDNEANYSLEILSNYIPKTTGWKEEFEVLE
ncbi:MAG: lamin tail domain-containing protein, partial [Bacteroidales bacterium]|nr:lamin tail domain-containing protein [Bacteroidales bacterium]